MRKSFVAVAAVAAASLALIGLAPMASSATKTADNIAVAKKVVGQFSPTPKSINITSKLKTKPAKGLLIVGLSNGGDENKVLDEGLAAGAAVFGWKFTEIAGAVSPDTQRAAFQQALNLKPAGIHISGIEPSTLSDLLDKAKAMNIPVVCSACMSKPTSALVDTHIAGARQLDAWGNMIAAFVAAQTNCNANVQGITVPLYPILIRFDVAFQASLKKYCPNAKYTANPQQLTDIFAGKVPAAVVNIMKTNPDTNWLVSDLGGWMVGVPSALKTAGLNGKAQIGGLTAGKANIQGVKDGTETAWTGYSLPIVGWTVIDSFARIFTKQALNTKDLPTQILTPQNAASLVLTPQGDYLGVKDYQAQFKKVWGF
jgi:ribose transport system substrate-binding protein